MVPERRRNGSSHEARKSAKSLRTLLAMTSSGKTAYLLPETDMMAPHPPSKQCRGAGAGAGAARNRNFWPEPEPV